jgi:hypothetical protein
MNLDLAKPAEKCTARLIRRHPVIYPVDLHGIQAGDTKVMSSVFRNQHPKGQEGNGLFPPLGFARKRSSTMEMREPLLSPKDER